jgi:hypothetical protein
MGYRAGNWTSIHSVAFGYCMNNLIPRSGELARCTLLNRAEKIPVEKLIGTVILERIVDFILLFSLLFIAFLLHADALQRLLDHTGANSANSSSGGALKWIIMAAVVLAFVVGLYLLKKFKHISWIGKIWSFMQGIGEGIKTIFKLRQKTLFIVLSLGIWISWTLMTYSILKALTITETMSLADVIFFMAAGSLGMVVPTPGGVGAFHYMSKMAFMALGYDGKVGIIFALISWSAKTAFDILVGFLGFVVVTSKKIKL